MNKRVDPASLSSVGYFSPMAFKPGMKVIAANAPDASDVGEIVRLARREELTNLQGDVIDVIEIYDVKWQVPSSAGGTVPVINEVPGAGLKALPSGNRHGGTGDAQAKK